MRRSREEKAETHGVILAKASRLFRERGIEATSLGEVMTAAGLTHGGFYRHFEDKDALAAASVGAAFDEVVAKLDAQAALTGPADAAARYFADYLADDHVANPGYGCPVATLGGEISRASPELKASFSEGFNRVVDTLAKGPQSGEPQRRSEAIRELAKRVGAVLIARASDGPTASEVLAACRGPTKGGAGPAARPKRKAARD